jgi:hypothetical protein
MQLISYFAKRHIAAHINICTDIRPKLLSDTAPKREGVKMNIIRRAKNLSYVVVYTHRIFETTDNKNWARGKRDDLEERR